MENNKFLNTLNQYFTQVNSKDVPPRDIVQDASYMRWLEKATKKYGFLDDTDDFTIRNMDSESYEKIKYLRYLYHVVEHYATINYLPSWEYNSWLEDHETYHLYNIKFGDNVYAIAYVEEDRRWTSFYFVEKKSIDDVESWIDFSDIQKGEKTERARRIDTLFNQLGDIITQISDEKVEEEAIINEIGKMLVKKDIK